MSVWARIAPRYVTKPTRTTHPCISSGSLNRVPALIRWGLRWQCYLNTVGSRSGEACLQTAIRCLLTLLYFTYRVVSTLTGQRQSSSFVTVAFIRFQPGHTSVETYLINTRIYWLHFFFFRHTALDRYSLLQCCSLIRPSVSFLVF